ncbi:hypothetical protein [Rhizobium leguminosarum]|uniref:Uncharacterized protein n=1 Tax=Rhizobium leguminosarum TaxID=384 RepID=A0A1B1CHK8_RHILE|nr:hypothetical protein [Rhizobium leguminosarum]ANP89231.1 hypothetical protein BA011_25905 [Rhizobium leguminosarum]
MKSLSPAAGKTIAIIGDASFLPDDVRQALVARQAVVIGPLAVSSALQSLSGRLVCDAAIVDVTVSDEAMLSMSNCLEARGIPFVFAHERHTRAPAGGFILSSRASHIDAMIAALFGSGTAYRH